METLEHHISSEKALFAACMPFIKGGGIFIKTLKSLALGDTVSISILLLDDPEPLHFEGKVVWITPAHEHAHLAQGVGVQFPPKEAKTLRAHIEKHAPDAFAGNGLLG